MYTQIPTTQFGGAAATTATTTSTDARMATLAAQPCVACVLPRHAAASTAPNLCTCYPVELAAEEEPGISSLSQLRRASVCALTTGPGAVAACSDAREPAGEPHHGMRWLQQKGWLQRGWRPTLWCPTCQGPVAGPASGAATAMPGGAACYVGLRLQGLLPLLPSALALGSEAPRCCWAMVWTTCPWSLPWNQGLALQSDASFTALQGPDGDVFLVSSHAQVLDSFVAATGWLPGHWSVLEANVGAKCLANTCRAVLPCMSNGYNDSCSSRDECVDLVLVADLASGVGTGIVHLAPGCSSRDCLLLEQCGFPLDQLHPGRHNGLAGDAERIQCCTLAPQLVGLTRVEASAALCQLWSHQGHPFWPDVVSTTSSSPGRKAQCPSNSVVCKPCGTLPYVRLVHAWWLHAAPTHMDVAAFLTACVHPTSHAEGMIKATSATPPWLAAWCEGVVDASRPTDAAEHGHVSLVRPVPRLLRLAAAVEYHAAAAPSRTPNQLSAVSLVAPLATSAASPVLQDAVVAAMASRTNLRVVLVANVQPAPGVSDRGARRLWRRHAHDVRRLCLLGVRLHRPLRWDKGALARSAKEVDQVRLIWERVLREVTHEATHEASPEDTPDAIPHHVSCRSHVNVLDTIVVRTVVGEVGSIVTALSTDPCSAWRMLHHCLVTTVSQNYLDYRRPELAAATCAALVHVLRRLVHHFVPSLADAVEPSCTVPPVVPSAMPSTEWDRIQVAWNVVCLLRKLVHRLLSGVATPSTAATLNVQAQTRAPSIALCEAFPCVPHASTWPQHVGGDSCGRPGNLVTTTELLGWCGPVAWSLCAGEDLVDSSHQDEAQQQTKKKQKKKKRKGPPWNVWLS